MCRDSTTPGHSRCCKRATPTGDLPCKNHRHRSPTQSVSVRAVCSDDVVLCLSVFHRGLHRCACRFQRHRAFAGRCGASRRLRVLRRGCSHAGDRSCPKTLKARHVRCSRPIASLADAGCKRRNADSRRHRHGATSSCRRRGSRCGERADRGSPALRAVRVFGRCASKRQSIRPVRDRVSQRETDMQNDEAKKKASQEPQPEMSKGKGWERGNDAAPRRRRGPYGPIRNGRYAQRSPRNPG